MLFTMKIPESSLLIGSKGEKDMKTFAEITEEIKNVILELDAVDKKETELVDRWAAIPDLKKKHQAKKAAESEMLAVSEKKVDLKLTKMILENNARMALFHEVMPIVLEALMKHKGKSFGPKTKDKTYKEIKEKTGCYCYIDQSYLQSIRINTHMNRSLDIRCYPKNKILVDNKIQECSIEDITLYGDKGYVEDIPERVSELKKLHDEVREKQEELIKYCDEYNKLAVGDIPLLYYNKSIYQGIF